jgi:hypothetical protein
MDTQKTEDSSTSNNTGNVGGDDVVTTSGKVTVKSIPTPNAQEKSKHGSFKKVVVFSALMVSIAIIASAVLVGCFIKQSNSEQTKGYQGIDSSRYQAIFLTNGQVYFGKLSDNGTDLVDLNDIWYLQVQQGTQSAEALKNATEQGQVSLAKLGNELHGPDDEMSIAKDQVLFWENLKNDSKVVKTIQGAK